MESIHQFTQSIIKRMQQDGINQAIELHDLFSQYRGLDWLSSLSYERQKPVRTIIYQDPALSLVLIPWEGGKKSSKHGHPGTGGLIKVLTGSLRETRFDPVDTDRMIGRHLLSTGEVSYIHDDFAHHIVENPKEQLAVSLHLYTTGEQLTAEPVFRIPDSYRTVWTPAA